jgi:hypothetical protein
MNNIFYIFYSGLDVTDKSLPLECDKLSHHRNDAPVRSAKEKGQRHVVWSAQHRASLRRGNYSAIFSA